MGLDTLSVVDSLIEQFCESHSSLPSGHCLEIEQYTRQNEPYSIMLTGPLVGSFLGFLVASRGARRILEIGCFTGYSALCMAEHLPEGGELITLERDSRVLTIAKTLWGKSEHAKKIHPILGPAMESLSLLEGPFDMIFIDADKTGYGAYLERSLELLSPSGFIVADNSLYQGKVLSPGEDSNAKAVRQFADRISQDPSLQSVLLPIRDGLYLIRRRNP